MPNLPNHDVAEQPTAPSSHELAQENRQPLRAQGMQAGGYQPEYVNIAKQLSQLGASDERLQLAFNVSGKTLTEWRTANPEFAEACRAGTKTVEQALYRRAIGYDVTERKVQITKQGPVVVEETRHIPSDPRAAALLLRKHAPKEAQPESPYAQYYREIQGTALRPHDPKRQERELAKNS
jgi:hypothetical protein